MADRSRGWVSILLALVAAGLMTLLAPGSWPDGPGELRVTAGGETVVVPVEVGSTEEVRHAAGGLDAALPSGVPTGDRVTVELRAERALDLSDTRIVLALPGGNEELIPVIRALDDGGLLAGRTPPNHAPVALALLGLVVVLWVTEPVPLFVTSLSVPIVLVATGASTATDALAPFFHPIIALFLGGFLMAEAMRKVGLDHLAAVSIIGRAGRSPGTLFGAMLAITAFLSMWMSNTAAVAVLIPIALAISEPLQDLAYRKALVLGIAYAATIGGVGSAIGTPANPIAIAFLAEYTGRQISFAGWFGFGLPMVVAFLPLMGAWLWWTRGVAVDADRFAAARQAARNELEDVRTLSRPQWVVLGVFLAVVGVWLTQQLHGLDTGIVALAGAVALAALGRLDTQDVRSIAWEALLTFGGGLALGFTLSSSGVSDWVATRLEALSTLPELVAVLLVAVLTLALTAVASNTASAAVLVPLAIPLAAVIGVEPEVLVIVVAVASSIDFALVIGTPPTMMAYSTRLFTALEIFRAGIVLDAVGVLLLCTAVVTFWRLVGLV